MTDFLVIFLIIKSLNFIMNFNSIIILMELFPYFIINVFFLFSFLFSVVVFASVINSVKLFYYSKNLFRVSIIKIDKACNIIINCEFFIKVLQHYFIIFILSFIIFDAIFVMVIFINFYQY